MTEHVRLTISDQVATITIDRPQRRNAMSFAMWSAIPALIEKVRAEPTVRVLVINGSGHFSAGADISEFATLRADAAGARTYGAAVHAGERAIAELEIPTLAAITGFCIGGGCEIALACDLRIAAEDARFGITPANLGIVYNLTSTKQLVDAVGPAWAKQILYTADLIDGPTALRIGLVNELVPAEELPGRAAELAQRIASRAPVSVRGSKQIVGRITEGRYTEDEDVQALYDAAVLSREYAEGVEAFLAKRQPKF